MLRLPSGNPRCQRRTPFPAATAPSPPHPHPHHHLRMLPHLRFMAFTITGDHTVHQVDVWLLLYVVGISKGTVSHHGSSRLLNDLQPGSSRGISPPAPDSGCPGKKGNLDPTEILYHGCADLAVQSPIMIQSGSSFYFVIKIYIPTLIPTLSID